MFHESLEYNIAYGDIAKVKADRVALLEAIRLASLEEVVQRLPGGLGTMVGERGLKLSGGEKQRVAIARAVLKDTPVLLCDEPTSSLDNATEGEVMAVLTSAGRRHR